ncbi:MAG: hypothetical protein WD894_21685, partial [Pirellulales bacterium]
MNTLKNSVGRIRQFLRFGTAPELISRRKRCVLPPPRFIDCMELEDRTMMSATPLGVEAIVNATTANTQQTQAESPQAVAADASGNYVVAWSSQLQDGTGWGVYAQQFNAAGVAQGGEISVNTDTLADQQFASVAMDSAGNFVVVWSSTTSGDSEVKARLYNSSGVAQTGQVAVNTTTADEQSFASVAMDNTGKFVVTWTSNLQDGGGQGIYGQRFDSTGLAQGAEFLVNTTTANDQMHSQVAMDSDGDFVITWSSNLQDTGGWGVYAQRYNASGIAQGSEFQVNTTTANDQQWATVDMDSAGNFVVSWTSANQDTGGLGIYAQRYDAAGTALNGEFLLNTTTAGDQQNSRVSVDANGEFVITWSSFNQDSAGTWGVYAKKFTSGGAVEDAEFRVNTTLAGDQQHAAVVLTGLDTAVFVWSGNGPGDADGVFSQRYSFNDVPTVTPTVAALAYTENDGAVAIDAGVVLADNDDTQLASATITITGNYVNGQDTLTFTDQNGITGSWTPATGVLSLSGTATLANYQAALRSITYTNGSDNPATTTRTVTFVVNDGMANSVAATRDITIAAVNDAPVNAIPVPQSTNEDTALVFSSG